MIMNILLPVDDSPPALAAARVAVDLAAALGARVTAVLVVHQQPAPADPGPPVLRYVARRAGQAGVACTTEVITGEVVGSVLDRAQSLPADIIVLGRSGRHLAGDPYVGSHTRRVLEFSDRPVLVVPTRPATGARAGGR
jgi:nucleotide-binding universal stress UspA family protein